MACHVSEYSQDCEDICLTGTGSLDLGCLEGCYSFAGCPWPPEPPSLSSSSAAPGGGDFDWGKARQGFEDSCDVFLMIFACFVLVKLFRMAG